MWGSLLATGRNMENTPTHMVFEVAAASKSAALRLVESVVKPLMAAGAEESDLDLDVEEISPDEDYGV
jgi:hypothetical protein